MRWWVSIRFDNTIWLATVCVLSSSSTRISKTPTVNNRRFSYYLFISHYLAVSIEENFTRHRSRNMFTCLFDVLNMNPSFYCLKNDFFFILKLVRWKSTKFVTDQDEFWNFHIHPRGFSCSTAWRYVSRQRDSTIPSACNCGRASVTRNINKSIFSHRTCIITARRSNAGESSSSLICEDMVIWKTKDERFTRHPFLSDHLIDLMTIISPDTSCCSKSINVLYIFFDFYFFKNSIIYMFNSVNNWYQKKSPSSISYFLPCWM
jgi:hypothetical protein